MFIACITLKHERKKKKKRKKKEIKGFRIKILQILYTHTHTHISYMDCSLFMKETGGSVQDKHLNYLNNLRQR